MSHMTVGSWNSYVEPEWKEKLEFTSDYQLEKTGMNRKQIERLLEQLTEMEIIQADYMGKVQTNYNFPLMILSHFTLPAIG